MKKRNFVKFAVLFLLTTFLLFLVPSSSAQTNAQTNAPIDKKAILKGKAPAPAWMKMRSLTNEQRRAAAARASDRKAEHARKQKPTSQTGVTQ